MLLVWQDCLQKYLEKLLDLNQKNQEKLLNYWASLIIMKNQNMLTIILNILK